MSPAAHTDTLLDAALGYIGRGLEVFPVNERTKAPYTTNGMKDATTDPAQVRQWWQQHPSALIGCRVPARFVLLDIDPRHNGHDTWAELETAYAPIPVARQHHSGRGDGGFHAWFLRPDVRLSVRRLNDWAQRNNVGHAAGKRSWSSGIDILHHDQRYTILPPSPHPDTGLPYEWDRMETPGPMPDYLLHLVTAANTPAPAQPVRLVRDDDSIADWYTATSSWHDLLPHAGWELVEGDGDSDGSKWRHPNASAAASASVRHGCLFVYTPNTDFPQTEEGDPRGLTRFRAWSILEHGDDLSAAAREARALRDGPTPELSTLIAPGAPVAVPADTPWPDPRQLGDNGDRPPFPVDTLPTWIAAHVRQVADEMQFPPDLPAQLAIAGLSIACAGRARITVQGTWREHLNTYTVTAMPPGAGKSPALKQMLGCLDEWEADLIESGAAERDLIDTKRAILDKEKTKKINAGDTAGAAAILDELRALPDMPAPRLMADDATPEKIVDMLREQQGRLALISTEGGVFGLMAGRYSDRANLDVYLQAWSGDTIRVDRIGRPSSVVRNPTLTIGLTVQPSVITSLADLPELAGRGLLARFMYSIPEDNVGSRDMHKPPSIDPAVASHYGRNLVQLAERMHAAGHTELVMQPDAVRVFNTWRQDLEVRRGAGGDLRVMTEWTTKLESTVARLAGLLALADGLLVDAEVMGRAIAVGRYWEAHARHAHDMWGGDQVVARAGKFIDWAVDTGADEVTLRDVYAKALRRISSEEAIEVVALLVDNGWLRSGDGRPLVAGKRGVPSPVFAVHPESSRFRHNHARHARLFLNIQNCNSLSFSTFGDGPETCAHGAHGAHGAHEVEPAPDTAPPATPVDNPGREPLL